jgi:hypothetical protein
MKYKNRIRHFLNKQRVEEDGDKWKKELKRIDGTYIPTGGIICKVCGEINVGG